MQNCLGIYIENNLIKYAKVAKEKNNEFKVESYGVNFFDELGDGIKKVIEETYSYNTPISINLSNERYLYYDVFALLRKNDIEKTIETEFEAFCDEHQYNQKAFETRYALVPDVENKEKIKAIQVIVNKIELNRQKQYVEKHNISKILPIGTAIASIAKLDKKENALIVNMEEKTTITTIYDRQIYNVETLDIGSGEVLEKINRVENSLSKSYGICKGTTIYTSNVIDDTKEQPHLENIIPTLYQIGQKIQEVANESPVKISTIYLTGTLATVNNVDLYLQEFLPEMDCRILRPNIIEARTMQINLKDYIEVNSAIALAMQGLGEGTQTFNFKNANTFQQIKKILNMDIGSSSVQGKYKKSKQEKKPLSVEFKEPLDKTEKVLLRCIIGVLLINIIFVVFSKILYSQMELKQKEIQTQISTEENEITKMKNDIEKLNGKSDKYYSLTQEIETINNKISNIAEMKNSIPNLLNQLMYIIPEEVQLTSIENTSDKKIRIQARAEEYDKLGYFIARIRVEKFLNNVVSTRTEKGGEYVSVSIEGELP